MTDEVVIEQGVEIDFLNGIESIEHGIVNGPVVTVWGDGKVSTWIPVYCTSPSIATTIVVAAENITGARAYSVRV